MNLALKTELETLMEHKASTLGVKIDGKSQEPRVNALLV
jgi:hypothetical protein